MNWIALFGLLSTLVTSAYVWYLRSKGRTLEERALALESANVSLRSVNQELRASLQRAAEGMRSRHEVEERQDAKTVVDASGDAGRVAELLRGLHPDGNGPEGP
jgi:hypothetical protein